MIEGVVREIKVSFGQKVKQGEILAIIHSPNSPNSKLNIYRRLPKRMLRNSGINGNNDRR